MSKPDVVKKARTRVPKIVKHNTDRPKTNEKHVRQPVRYCEQYRTTNKPRGNQRNWNNLKSYQLGDDFAFHNKAFSFVVVLTILQLSATNGYLGMKVIELTTKGKHLNLIFTLILKDQNLKQSQKQFLLIEQKLFLLKGKWFLLKNHI